MLDPFQQKDADCAGFPEAGTMTQGKYQSESINFDNDRDSLMGTKPL